MPSTEEHPLTPLPQDALINAVKVPRRTECVAAICAALEAGADVNSRSSMGWPPLHYAASCNTDAVALTAAVEVLAAAGADVRAKNNYGREPLHRAAHNSKGLCSSCWGSSTPGSGGGCAGQGG